MSGQHVDGRLQRLVDEAADGAEKLASTLDVAGGIPCEEATWPPSPVNGSGRVTVGANSLGMAVNLSVMQMDGSERGRPLKPATQTAGFDPQTARHLAWQLIAAANWVDEKRRQRPE